MTIPEVSSESKGVRSLVGIAVLLILVTVLYANRRTDFVELAMRNETHLKQWVNESCVTAGLIAVLAYALASSLPVPVASIGSLFVGWLFGFWIGLPIVSIGSTLGASITFLITRYFFYDTIRAIRLKHLENFQQGFYRDSLYYIAALRLMPGLPFFLVNAFLAQTQVPFRTFWTASLISMLPGTAIHVAAGTSIPSLARMRDEGFRSVLSWQLGIALALLAVQPILLRAIVKRFRREEKTDV